MPVIPLLTRHVIPSHSHSPVVPVAKYSHISLAYKPSEHVYPTSLRLPRTRMAEQYSSVNDGKKTPSQAVHSDVAVSPLTKTPAYVSQSSANGDAEGNALGALVGMLDGNDVGVELGLNVGDSVEGPAVG